MARLVRPTLEDILAAIAGISDAVADKDIKTYAASWLLRSAVERGIEIISEASRRIPPALQATQPQIPWSQIMAIGNVLRHEYQSVSDAIVWNVVQKHLPPLREAVLSIRSELQEG